MKYRTKAEREAQVKRQNELNLRVTKLCVDFANYILEKREKIGNFTVTEKDLDEFATDRLTT